MRRTSKARWPASRWAPADPKRNPGRCARPGHGKTDLPQAIEKLTQQAIAHGQGVAAGEDDLVDLGLTGYIIDAVEHLAESERRLPVSDMPFPGTETTVGGAAVGRQQQYPRRVTMHHRRHR